VFGSQKASIIIAILLIVTSLLCAMAVTMVEKL